MELHSAEHKNVCICSSTIYVFLIAIIFAINIGIGTYFVYYKHMSHNKKTAPRYDNIYQATDY